MSQVPSLEAIQKAARYNEESIRNYKGKCTFQMLAPYPFDNDGKRLKPYSEPIEHLSNRYEVVVDLSEGFSYRADVSLNSQGDNSTSRTEKLLEVKKGPESRQLVYDSSGKPYRGVIPKMDTNLLLESWFDPMVHRSHVVCTNPDADGRAKGGSRMFVPLSKILERKDLVWIDKKLENIEGQRCVRLAAHYPDPSGKACMFAVVWLGLDLNLCIVKQLSFLVAAYDSEEHRAMMKEWPTLKDWLANYGKLPPCHVAVGDGYFQASPGVWAPARLIVYVLWPLDEEYVSDPADMKSFADYRNRNPHVGAFTEYFLAGIDICSIDQNSCSINNDIAPNTFSLDIFPAGMPLAIKENSKTSPAKRNFVAAIMVAFGIIAFVLSATASRRKSGIAKLKSKGS